MFIVLLVVFVLVLVSFSFCYKMSIVSLSLDHMESQAVFSEAWTPNIFSDCCFDLSSVIVHKNCFQRDFLNCFAIVVAPSLVLDVSVHLDKYSQSYHEYDIDLENMGTLIWTLSRIHYRSCIDVVSHYCILWWVYQFNLCYYYSCSSHSCYLTMHFMIDPLISVWSLVLLLTMLLIRVCCPCYSPVKPVIIMLVGHGAQASVLCITCM